MDTKNSLKWEGMPKIKGEGGKWEKQKKPYIKKYTQNQNFSNFEKIILH